MAPIEPRTPVLVGVGVAMQREEDPLLATEAIGLMIEATRRAGAAAGPPELLHDIDRIYVPRGRWDYGNPAGMIARAVGARRALTVLTKVGILQQSLMGDACRRIAEGEIDAALVAGGESGYRLLRAKIAGVTVHDTEDTAEPDVTMTPHSELRHPAELRAGLQMPIGLYAMIESAFRVARGRELDEHLDAIAGLYSRMSAVAAANPHAWQQECIPPEAIRVASDRNPMQAFPYTRKHCTSWSVDQASALLFCSAQKAQGMGIPEETWLYPLASTESNFMLPVSARARLPESPGARIAGRAALEHGGLAATDVDLLDLYTCFPIAVELFASELGLPLDGELTVTGGMPFAGGPYNNYVLQATARIAELLRQGRGRTGLVASLSGVVTKQAYGLWSTSPGPRPFAYLDVTDDVSRAITEKTVREDFAGIGVVAGYTVLHDRGKVPAGITIVDIEGDSRTVARTEDAPLIARMESAEFNGKTVRVDDGLLVGVEEG